MSLFLFWLWLDAAEAALLKKEGGIQLKVINIRNHDPNAVRS